MEELRKLLYKATTDKSSIAAVINYLNNNKEQAPFMSYRAMLLFLEAKYITSPLKKLKLFKRARKAMEEAVVLNTKDIETRFLRLSIQTKLPSFLDYSKNKEEDKDFIIKHFKELSDKNLKTLILQFFTENNTLTQEEYNQL